MRHEAPEPRFVEPIDPKLERSHFLVLNYLHDKQTNESLFAFDPNNAQVFDRQQGTGRLRLSEIGVLFFHSFFLNFCLNGGRIIG